MFVFQRRQSFLFLYLLVLGSNFRVGTNRPGLSGRGTGRVQKLLAHPSRSGNPVNRYQQHTVPRKTKTTAKETGSELSATAATEVNGADSKPPRSVPTKAKKAPAKKATKRVVSKKTSPKTSAGQPTDEQIRIRAYFIAERRHRLALPGDADSDWLEAKRQLLSEIGPR